MPKAPTLGLEVLDLEEMDGEAVAAGLAAGELALADTDISEDYVGDRLPGANGVRLRTSLARCPERRTENRALFDA